MERASETDNLGSLAAATRRLSESGNIAVRDAVQRNLVSFPAQVPVFNKQSRPDIQWKVAVLYFVRGWSMDEIARKYGLMQQRIGQIVTAWRVRALTQGYLQVIEPENLLLRLGLRGHSDKDSQARP